METSNLSNKERAFYELKDFPDYANLANQYAIIVNELKKNDFWMKWGSDNYDPSGHCNFLHGDWTVCPIYFGNYDPHSIKIPNTDPIDVEGLLFSLPIRFPETTRLLKGIKTLNYAAFSRLHPKSKLDPHRHSNFSSLIFHLGLAIPSGNTCGLQVNGEVHIWTKPGDAVIFNDTLEHSAWNDSNEERIILYIDFVDYNH